MPRTEQEEAKLQAAGFSPQTDGELKLTAAPEGCAPLPENHPIGKSTAVNLSPMLLYRTPRSGPRDHQDCQGDAGHEARDRS